MGVACGKRSSCSERGVTGIIGSELIPDVKFMCVSVPSSPSYLYIVVHAYVMTVA